MSLNIKRRPAWPLRRPTRPAPYRPDMTASLARAFLYRWRLHPGREPAFETAWATVTRHLQAAHGSFGSRLHRGDDGLWYAYAAWPSVAHRAAAFGAEAPETVATAADTMQACVAESFPEIQLTPTCDLLDGLPTSTATDPTP